MNCLVSFDRSYGVDVSVAVHVPGRLQVGHEVGERRYDVVVEHADDVRARVERVADQRYVDVLRGAVKLGLELLEDLRQDCEQRAPSRAAGREQALEIDRARRQGRVAESGSGRCCTSILIGSLERDADGLDAQQRARVVRWPRIRRVRRLVAVLRVGAEWNVTSRSAKKSANVFVLVVRHGVDAVLDDRELRADLADADAACRLPYRARRRSGRSTPRSRCRWRSGSPRSKPWSCRGRRHRASGRA